MHYHLTDYLMDLVHNAIEAGSDHITVDIHQDDAQGVLELTVRDNGPGMDEALQRRVLDPFCTDGKKHPERRMGLGLAFLKQLLDMTGGTFSLRSEPGEGTRVHCRFNPGHIDCPPLGDLSGSLMALFSYPGSFELELNRSRGDLQYRVYRSELHDVLGGFDDPESLSLLNQFLESQEDFHGETDP
ncbi:ATP-binding protein [Salinispira pacifica]|nr:ATP-binding protein [Salinispira pacifica]